MKKVSVIVPVYKVEKYLNKCLESLVNQTLQDIEIIVVNDGSPDNCQSIIDNYKQKYPDKIISIVKENGGQGSARNVGLEKSNGEYIGYVDSDDYIELDMYEKLYNKAITNDYDVVICDNFVVNEKNGKKYPECNYKNDHSILENAFLGKIAVWNKIYKRKILVENKIKFKEKVWYEDFAFTFKVMACTNKIAYVDKPLYNYLLRKGSTMNNNNIAKNTEIFDAFDDATNYLKEKKIYQKYYDLLEFNAIDHIYISTCVRVINAQVSKKLKKKVMSEILSYMNKNFETYRNNKYIVSLSKNRKIIYDLLEKKRYLLIKLIFFSKNVVKKINL